MSAGTLAQNTWEMETGGAGIQGSSPYIVSLSTWLGYMEHPLKQEKEKEKRNKTRNVEVKKKCIKLIKP